jgi:hypothetical protein
MQALLIVRDPAFLGGSQPVAGRFDFDQLGFFLSANEEIRPACTPGLVVLNEIAKEQRRILKLRFDVNG